MNFLIVDLAIILLFAGAIYFSAPLWLTAIATGLFVGAFAYLSGILYGVVNDLFATQANLPYFLLGHQEEQYSILKTNDKIAQAIAWGIYATHGLSFLAGVLFTIAITITAFFVPISTFALPLVMIAMPLVAIAVEFIIRTNPRHYLIPSDYRSKIMNVYQNNRFDFMCPTDKEQSNWLSNSERNGNGYVIVPLIAVVALISLIVLSAVSIYLPPLLFISPIIAMAIPAVFAAVTCIALIIAGMYMHRNRDKQVDDRYRLEFGNGPQGKLCLDNDKDKKYFNKVLEEGEEIKPTLRS